MNKRFLAIVAAILVILIGVWLAQPSKKINSGSTSSSSGATLAPSSIVSDIATVPETTLQTIGLGSADAEPQAISAPALVSNNKPEVFYEGAEYCPYCATERWAMAVALSKFGSFQNLKLTHSSTTDVYPNTHTLSFYGTTYTSSYINFTPVEIYTNIPSNGFYTALQTPTSAQQALASKYDSNQSIPFIDFGGKYAVSGATYNPAVLQGKSWSDIAGSLADPNNVIAKGVDGAANTLTAAICKLTNNNPADVCNSVVVSLEDKL